jgi:hypothetical protein
LKKYFYITLLLFLVNFRLTGQEEKRNATYQFLKVPVTAKSSSLGGRVISQFNDIQYIHDNPALLDSSVSNKMTLSYLNHFADINFGHFTYAKEIKKIGVFAAGIRYANYGKFDETNEFGDNLGEFKAAEYEIAISYSKPLNDYFNIGVSLKNIYSILNIYRSYALGMDIATAYKSKDKSFSAGFILSNIGSQITTYTTNNREPLPFEMLLGISKKLGHAPFRVNLLTTNLQKWNISNQNFSTSNTTKSIFIADNIMRHLVFGVEFIPSSNFYINIAYNHKVKQEMKVVDRSGMLGFSFGTGMKISKFSISFARSAYHFAGASTTISIVTNINDFYKK